MRLLFCLSLSLSLLLSAEVNTAPLHVKFAAKYLYVRETKGPNRSPEIDKWNRAVGAAYGDPYCASSESYFIDSAEQVFDGTIDFKVRSAWSQAFKTKKSHSINDVANGSYKPKAGDFLVWRSGNTSKGHIEVIEWYDEKRKEFHTIGYNTSSGITGDQRDGDGGFRRIRRITPGSYFRITHIVSVNYYEKVYTKVTFSYGFQPFPLIDFSLSGLYFN